MTLQIRINNHKINSKIGENLATKPYLSFEISVTYNETVAVAAPDTPPPRNRPNNK